MARARKWIMCQYSSHGIKSSLTQTHNILPPFPSPVMCDVRRAALAGGFALPRDGGWNLKMVVAPEPLAPMMSRSVRQRSAWSRPYDHVAV